MSCGNCGTTSGGTSGWTPRSCVQCDTFVAVDATGHQFLRTLCRWCDGTISGVTNTELDGLTAYNPTGAVRGIAGEGLHSVPHRTEVPASGTWEMPARAHAVTMKHTAGAGTATITTTDGDTTLRVNGTATWTAAGATGVLDAPLSVECGPDATVAVEWTEFPGVP